MVKQLCFKYKGFDLASRKAEFEIVQSTDFEKCSMSNLPSIKFDEVVENGLATIANQVSKAAKNIQNIENCLSEEIVIMYELFNEYHPENSLRLENYTITGN